MGCGSISNHSVKNSQILGFFLKCQSHQFTRSRVVKITEYGFHYCRGSKTWKQSQSKSIFNDSHPALLSPCQPDKFDELILSLENFKQLYTQEFKNFPKNIGMLLCIGDKFPYFNAEILGSHQKSIFEIQSNVPTIFVFWKLKQQITMCKLQVTRRQTANLFSKDDSSSSYLENAFKRAKKTIKRPINLIGICYDSPELKSQYQSEISNEDIHIWINENDQSAQVFKYAEDINQDIRTIEQSIYVVNQNGIFVGCLKENFGDPQFLHELNDLIDSQPIQNNKPLQIQQQIRRDDYQKAKKLIKQLLPDREKKPIGDTFNFQIKKMTYYIDYEKIGATYCTPIFEAAGSLKYKQNCDELIEFVKEYTPVAHMETNFKENHSLNKKKFFEKLCERIKNTGYEDFRFILEKSLEIFYNQESKQFEMRREITSVHNVPLSVSCVYARKDQMQKLGKSIMDLREFYSNKEIQLLKEYFNTPYIVQTSFNVGTLFSPIPNCYKIQHNDFSGTSQINQSIIRPKGIFDSKLVQSVNQSVDNQEQENADQMKNSQNNLVLSEIWDNDNKVDFNYDQIDTIQQINNEVLVIFLIDYADDKQTELLLQLLDFIHRNGWQNDKVRVIGLSSKGEQTEQFDQKVNRLERQLKKGVLEIWFPINQNFVGVHFNKLLADLYGLDFSSPILVIDHLKRLLYRGMPDQKFAPLLTKIINQQSLKSIHSSDRPLKHRIDLAQFQREWRIIKQYGNNSLLYSSAVQETLKFLEKLPLKKGEFWSVKIKQFQLWNEKGQFVRKCVEKPQIIYKIEKPEINVKFYNIIEELLRLVGKDRIEIIDLNQENTKEKNQLLGESLIK